MYICTIVVCITSPRSSLAPDRYLIYLKIHCVRGCSGVSKRRGSSSLCIGTLWALPSSPLALHYSKCKYFTLFFYQMFLIQLENSGKTSPKFVIYSNRYKTLSSSVIYNFFASCWLEIFLASVLSSHGQAISEIISLSVFYHRHVVHPPLPALRESRNHDKFEFRQTFSPQHQSSK